MGIRQDLSLFLLLSILPGIVKATTLSTRLWNELSIATGKEVKVDTPSSLKNQWATDEVSVHQSSQKKPSSHTILKNLEETTSSLEVRYLKSPESFKRPRQRQR